MKGPEKLGALAVIASLAGGGCELVEPPEEERQAYKESLERERNEELGRAIWTVQVAQHQLTQKLADRAGITWPLDNAGVLRKEDGTIVVMACEMDEKMVYKGGKIFPENGAMDEAKRLFHEATGSDAGKADYLSGGTEAGRLGCAFVSGKKTPIEISPENQALYYLDQAAEILNPTALQLLPTDHPVTDTSYRHK